MSDFQGKNSCRNSRSFNDRDRDRDHDRNRKGCDCDSFFKDISRGEDVKVFFKGGGHVSGEFINVRGDVVILAKAKCHHHHDGDCKCKKDKVKIITICCEDIVAVQV